MANKKKNPLNVSDALNMERTPEALPKSKTEYPVRTVRNKPESKQRTEKNETIHKENVIIPKSESPQKHSSKTLLALAKGHDESTNETDRVEDGGMS